ncbi:MAG: PAS domain S-box protein [Patescibacteria group bacterium]
MIFEATFQSKKQLEGDVFELTFKLLRVGKILFHPGQYIWLILPKLASSDPKGERRAFSITSSCVQQNSLSILFRASDSGYKKTLLAMPAGSKVHINGPHGQTFVVDKNTGSHICYIAGGVGIAPFLGILRSFDRLVDHPAITLIFLNSKKEKEFLRDELKQITEKSGVRFIKHVGIFDSAVLSRIPQAQSATYFICGPQGMVDDVSKKLKKSGIPAANMRFEQYYPAAKNPILDQVLLDDTKRVKSDPDGLEKIMLGNMFIYSCLFAAIFSGGIGLYYSFSGIPFSQNYIPYIGFCISFFSYIAYKLHKNLAVASHGVITFSMLLTLLALYQGAQMGSATYWLYFFPIIAFFFKGIVGGTIWTVVYAALIGLIYLLSSIGLTPFQYNPSRILLSLTSVSFVSILTFFISSLSEKLRERLARSNAFKSVFQSVYRFAVESSTNHMIITDTNGVIIYANRAAQETTGYTFSEMQGNTPRLWGGNMNAEFFRDLWEKKKMWMTARNPKSIPAFIGEIKNTRKNGEQYIALTKISPVINQIGVTIGFIGTEEDITNRLKLEQSLKIRATETEKEKIKVKATLQSIGEGIFALDTRERVLLINKKAEEMLGLSMADFHGKTFFDVIRAETEDGKTLPQEKRASGMTLRSGETRIQDYVFNHKDGSKFLAHITAAPFIVEKKIFGVVVVIRDITKEREVEKAKNEFISLASHQLRTPLSAVNWYAEMLLSGDAGKASKTQKEYLKEIYAGNQRMVELVNSLLNVSRLEMGTFTIETEQTDIEKLARDVMGELHPMIEPKKIKVKQQYGKPLPALNADPKLLRIILQNILSNAVKYTPEKGRVSLDIRTREKGETIGGKTMAEPVMAITISDTGYGIPKNQQGKIFTKLFRADNVRQMDTEGTGLGLYIVKSVVDHSGGTIWFLSPGELAPDGEKNKGATFYVIFPVGGMKSASGGEEIGRHAHAT